MKNKKTVLITCVGGGLSFALIESLKVSLRYDYRIIGTDTNEDVIAKDICDVFSLMPHGEATTYSKSILQLCIEQNVDLVFPCSDPEALALSRDQEMFTDNGIALACNRYDILRVICDKAQTYEKLAEIGVPTPYWCRTNSKKNVTAEVEQLLASTNGAVVKLTSGRGSRGIFVVNKNMKNHHYYNQTREIHTSPADFFNVFLPKIDFSERYIVMEKLIGPVCDLDILAWEGKVIHALPRRRLDSARPNDGHIIEANEGVKKFAKLIVANMNLSWIFDIDFMFSIDKKPRILEINPRASGSIAVPIVAGVPIFDDLLDILEGKKIATDDYPYGSIIYPVKSLRKR